jgi:hypothetical protein
MQECSTVCCIFLFIAPESPFSFLQTPLKDFCVEHFSLLRFDLLKSSAMGFAVRSMTYDNLLLISKESSSSNSRFWRTQTITADISAVQ